MVNKIYVSNTITKICEFTLPKGKYVIKFGGDLSQACYAYFSLGNSDEYSNTRGEYISGYANNDLSIGLIGFRAISLSSSTKLYLYFKSDKTGFYIYPLYQIIQFK